MLKGKGVQVTAARTANIPRYDGLVLILEVYCQSGKTMAYCNPGNFQKQKRNVESATEFLRNIINESKIVRQSACYLCVCDLQLMCGPATVPTKP